MNPNGNHDRFPTLADGSRDILHSHSHIDTWKSMEKLLATGKAKAIGVSNVSNGPFFPLPPPSSPSLFLEQHTHPKLELRSTPSATSSSSSPT